MISRARLVAVLGALACGALGVISSTQPWLTVALAGAARAELVVPGAAAVPVLAPLSLAVLALGGAVSIVGVVLRHVFAALTILIAALLVWATAPIVFAPTAASAASIVTEATGITGEEAVAGIVAALAPTPWPAITLLGWIALFAVGVFALATARHWGRTGRRYRTDDPGTPSGAARPDSVDSWDDLSRGQDPTDRSLD